VTAHDELCAYTLTHGDEEFIHQYVVDAFAAQHANEHSKPIQITFALVGLYLAVEHGMSGRQVQRVHMQLGRRKHVWPTFVLPTQRGAMTAADVILAAEGDERDAAIRTWCRDVWSAFSSERTKVDTLLRQHGVLPLRKP
jgi:hypothetical protein